MQFVCLGCGYLEKSLFAEGRVTNEVWVLLHSEGLSLLCRAMNCGCVQEWCVLLERTGVSMLPLQKLGNCRGTVWSNGAVSFYIDRKLALLSLALKCIILALPPLKMKCGKPIIRRTSSDLYKRKMSCGVHFHCILLDCCCSLLAFLSCSVFLLISSSFGLKVLEFKVIGLFWPSDLTKKKKKSEFPVLKAAEISWKCSLLRLQE